MLRILFCDDEPAQEFYFREALKIWEEKRKDTVSVRMFHSAEEVLFELGDTVPYDLLVLDIQMQRMNGMELARAIREKDRKVAIAFVTNDPGFVFQGYEVEAAGYLMKPVQPEQLCDLLDRIVEKKGREQRYLIFRHAGEDCRLAEDEILYLESDGHYLRIHGTGQVYEIKGKLQETARSLEGEGWIWPHRSYFVNLDFVEKITRTECVLENQERIPVSRNRYREVSQAFLDYYTGKNKG